MFSNPLCGLGCDTPDPWIQTVNRSFHWVYTSTGPLYMRTANTMAGLHKAEPQLVWDGPGSENGMWAPELHYWETFSTWYIYVTAHGAPNRILVLESTTGYPGGPYRSRGYVVSDAIDPNILHHPDGSKYLIFKSDRMTLRKLASPWKVDTTVTPVDLPLLKCPRPGNQWYEAPATLVREGTVWLMYSRCNTGPNYEVMLASCALKDGILNASAWKMASARPVIVGNGGDDTGPGHSGWFASPDGKETWVVYHGSAVGERGRSSRAMRVTFDTQGVPTFAQPPPVGQQCLEPSGESNEEAEERTGQEM